MSLKPNVPNIVTYVAVLLIACVAWSCAGNAPAAGGVDDASDQLELSCELALHRLQELIDAAGGTDNATRIRLAEAAELYRIGKELYLERAYALALEMLEEGIRLFDGVQ